MSRALVVLMLMSVALFGCGGGCESGAIAGSYHISQDSNVYELDLRINGSGVLKRDNAPVGSMTWEVEKSTGQVLLNVSGAALDALRRLVAADPPPTESIQTRSAYFAVSPQCTWTGRVHNLDLDEDGMRSFKRTAEK